MVGKVAGEKIIRAPPKEEEGTKEKGGGKTVVYAPYPVGPSLNSRVSLIWAMPSRRESQTIF